MRILCLIGLIAFFSYAEWKVIRLYNTAKHWPVVEGTVISSEMKESVHPFRQKHEWKRVTYTYTVNTHNFTGNTYSTNSQPTYFGIGTKNFLKEYPHGKRVNVYYNPASPSEAYLKVESFGLWDWVTLLFLVCFSFSLVSEFKSVWKNK